MVKYAEGALQDYVTKLRELKTQTNTSFSKVFEWIIEVLRERAEQIYDLLVAELKSKGIPLGCGPSGILNLLNEYIKKKGYYGIVCVNERDLPVAAAAASAFKELHKGYQVILKFHRYGILTR